MSRLDPPPRSGWAFALIVLLLVLAIVWCAYITGPGVR